MTALPNTPQSIKAGEEIYYSTMFELYGEQNKKIPSEQGSLWEAYAVPIADSIRQELNAENNEDPFVLREIYSNGLHKTFNDFVNDTAGLPPEKIREILEKGVKNRGMTVDPAATNKDLHNMWQQGDCADLKEMKLERMLPTNNQP